LKAREEFAQEMRKIVKSHVDNWQAAAWWLERIYREEYGLLNRPIRFQDRLPVHFEDLSHRDKEKAVYQLLAEGILSPHESNKIIDTITKSLKIEENEELKQRIQELENRIAGV